MTDTTETARLLRAGNWSEATDRVVMTHAERKLRHRRLETAGQRLVDIDLPEGAVISPGDALALPDGQIIEVVAANEPLIEITGDLVLAALCIGQHRGLCQVESDRLLVPQDAGLETLLGSIGVALRRVSAPFTPVPLFAAGPGQHRKHVHFHVSRLCEEEEDEEPDEVPASNA